MNPDVLLKHDGRVPRYTSYPTAAQFRDGFGAETHAAWLAGMDPDAPVSLYLHVPFCQEMCWYCGCNTQVVRGADRLARYADLLRREINRVADLAPARLPVVHVAWGGGTPTMLAADDLAAIMDLLRERFSLRLGAEIAFEADPRVFARGLEQTLAAVGANRISLGVQDFNPQVQRAINRVQTPEQTAAVIGRLRAVGVERFNLDLVYGLPHQSTHGVARTVDLCLELGAQRYAVFGYAHVPWMKKHQNLIDEGALPDARARLELYAAIDARLTANGFSRIGLDHFAAADDALARAQQAGGLRRNFQGYTTDAARTVIGFGASAISSFATGYVQNASAAAAYGEAISAGRLAASRGVETTAEDHLVADIIERLMCALCVDVAQVCAAHGARPDAFLGAFDRLAPLVADGLVAVEGWRVVVTEPGRLMLRNACAAFDRYFSAAPQRHARAI